MQSGLKSLVVWALSDNEPAVEFYRALGGRRWRARPDGSARKVLDKVAFAWNSVDAESALSQTNTPCQSGL